MNDKEQRVTDFYDGVRTGIRMYAHWKDGVQYVGTTGSTLARALANIAEEEAAELNKVKEV